MFGCLCIYICISSSDLFFYLAVVMLYVAAFATNRWPLPYEYSQIGPIFFLQIFILVLNWIYLFVLELVIASGCQFWRFGVCNASYVGHKYAMVAGMLGME